MKTSWPKRTHLCRTLRSGIAVSVLALGTSQALADNECGSGPTVVCAPSGNPYPQGITYQNQSSLNLSFAAGATVNTSAFYGLRIWNSSGGAGTLVIDTSQGSITSPGYGISAQGYPSISITSGNITANYGILVSTTGDVVVNSTAGSITAIGSGITAYGNSVNIVAGNVSTSSNYGSGIFVFGTTSTIDTTAGTVSATGFESVGIGLGRGSSGSITSGDVSVSGARSNAINASYVSSLTINTFGGALSTRAADSSAISVLATGPSSITSGAISTQGAQSAGINIWAGRFEEEINGRPVAVPAARQITVDTTRGLVQTVGASSAGILISSSETNLAITAGAISTAGDAAFAIAAISAGSAGQTSNFILQGPLSAAGADAGGLVVRDTGTGGAINVHAQAAITATGQNAVGIAAASLSGPVSVTVDPGVTVTGGWARTAAALSLGASRSENTASSSGERYSHQVGGGLPAAGIVLFSGAPGSGALLINNGIIGALGDRAVAMGFPCAQRSFAPVIEESRLERSRLPALLHKFASAVLGAIVPSAHAAAPPADPGCSTGDPARSLTAVRPVTIDNNNLMTGYVTLWDGAAHTFNNSGSFAVRHFADTNGDGVRDTKAVSISDFGGPNSAFNNSGTVRFAPVANAATTNAAGYYVPTTGIDNRPLEAGFYDLTREGVVQGQFVNLQSFNNSGIIDLRGPAIGNTLVMTSNATAGGAPGTGTFVANGGQLLVNTRLNEGIAPGGAANSYSDMLIVDRTQLGSGATSIGVSYDPASAGALTTGNGIAIVEVRDKANSATGVFVLGNRVAGGAYEYRLYRNGVGADGTDGNWYLRSTRIVAPEVPGPDPEPGQNPDPEPARPIERPNYRVEVPVDAIVPALASRLGMTMIGTFDDRYGTDYAPLSEQAPAPAPAREIWCKDAARNFRCTPTPQQNAYYAGVDQQAPLPAGHLFWARVFGQFGAHNGGGRTEADRLNAFERNGSSYGYRMGGIQFGAHLYRDPLNTLGVYFGYGRIGATVDTVYGEGRAGSVTMDAYSLGGYWTHRRPSGWYFDTVLQATHYGAINATSVLGERLNTRGWGFAASLEAGYPIALGAGWTLTPQLQAIYQTVSIDGGADRFGQVHYADTQSVHGRVGARLSRDFAVEDGRKVTAWARVNYWHTFGGNGRATFANLTGGYPVALGAGLGGSWMQFGIGASGQISQNLSVFASGDYNLTVANGTGHSYTGRVGLQVRW